MSSWRKLFGGANKPAPVNAATQPPAAGAKLRIPKPARIYVAGKSFLPTDEQQIFGVKGFFSGHDNLKPDVPRGAVWQGVMAFGSDVKGFCDYSRSTIFDDLYGPHPGAYCLDAVLLLHRRPHDGSHYLGGR